MTIGQGNPVNVFGAVPTISLANDKVMAGIAFTVRKRFVLASSGSVDIVFDPTAAIGKNAVILPIGFDGLGGPLHVDIYKGVTANSDGTPIPIVNRDFNIPAAPDSIAQIDPTGVNIGGLTPLEFLVPSDGAGVANTTGSSIGGDLVTNLKITEKILLRITNTDGTAGATVGLKFDFFEVS